MGKNYTSNLYIYIHLKPGTMEKPDTWLASLIDEIFAREGFTDYCGLESVHRFVKCKPFEYRDGILVDAVSLKYIDFHVGGDYDTDYDALLAEITDAIKAELEKAEATGDVRITGYDSDRDPDISAHTRVGDDPSTGTSKETTDENESARSMYEALRAVKEHDDAMYKSDNLEDIGLPGELRSMVVEAIAKAEGCNPGEALSRDVEYLDRLQGIGNLVFWRIVPLTG